MGNVSFANPFSFTTATATPRRRTHSVRCALHETGAVALTPEEFAVVSQALSILETKLRRARDPLSSPRLVKEWLQLHYALLRREVFGLLLLDSQNRLLAHEQLFSGTNNQCPVYPREVVRCVLGHNAAAVVAVHCHPSGVAEPSHSDVLLTRRLRDALALIDVRLLDHLIVAEQEIVSFTQRGLL